MPFLSKEAFIPDFAGYRRSQKASKTLASRREARDRLPELPVDSRVIPLFQGMQEDNGKTPNLPDYDPPPDNAA